MRLLGALAREEVRGRFGQNEPDRQVRVPRERRKDVWDFDGRHGAAGREKQVVFPVRSVI